MFRTKEIIFPGFILITSPKMRFKIHKLYKSSAQ